MGGLTGGLAMAGIGHNGGPGLEPGGGWRTHCWRAARESLLPHLPVEVVRTRVRRAEALGLPYRTYAGFRATTGHDIIAFLFSSNALRLLVPAPQLPADRAAKLAAIGACERIGLAQPPLTAGQMRQAAPALDAACRAPYALGSERAARADIRAALGWIAADTVLLIGEGELERNWCAAARLGGYLPAAQYFAP